MEVYNITQGSEQELDIKQEPVEFEELQPVITNVMGNADCDNNSEVSLVYYLFMVFNLFITYTLLLLHRLCAQFCFTYNLPTYSIKR